MGVFNCYYDASGTQKGEGSIVVVGLVSTVEKWVRFEKAWNAALEEFGVTHFHMKDFAHSRREFQEWKGDEPKRAAFLNRLIGTIKRGTHKAFVVSVSLDEFAAANRLYQLSEFYIGGKAYSFAAFSCMLLVRDWIKRKYPGYRIHDIVEKGDDGQPELVRLVNLMKWEFSFLPKVDPDNGTRLCAFEAADLVAWETKRFYDDFNAQPRVRRMRQSNRRLNEVVPFDGGRLDVEAMCAKYPQFYPPRSTDL
jgi:hypothetical protein